MIFRALSERPWGIGHGVLAVLHEPGVDVQSAAGLAGDDLGGEAHFQVVPVGHLPHRPLGRHQLVGGVLDGHRQELDLVLHHLQVPGDDVAHLGMAVLDLAAHLADHLHGLPAHQAPLGEGMGLVVAPLLDDRVDAVHFREQVVLQLAQGLHLQPGARLQGALGLLQDVLGGALQGIPVAVVEAADQVEGGHLGERVDEGGAEPGHHVQVAGIRLHEREQAGAVDALAHGQDPVQVGPAVDDEVQLLQAAVPGHVAEVDHPDVVLLDEPDEVTPGELPSRLLQGLDHLVGIQGELVVHGSCSWMGGNGWGRGRHAPGPGPETVSAGRSCARPGRPGRTPPARPSGAPTLPGDPGGGRPPPGPGRASDPGPG